MTYSKMTLHRGDVILCKIPLPSEELTSFKRRPAVVVSKNSNNERLEDVIVAICTSNLSRKQEPTQYLITGAEIDLAGIKVASVVKCESLLTINKSMIMRILGKLSAKGSQAVNDCLKDALALNKVERADA